VKTPIYVLDFSSPQFSKTLLKNSNPYINYAGNFQRGSIKHI